MKDELFIRGKVPMTKEDVRILTLARLQLESAKSFIDIGAGTGSVCIEAALRYPALQCTALEKNPEALALIAQNQTKFAVKNLTVIAGAAPEALPSQMFDAVFVGGSSGALLAIIQWAHAHLQAEGRLVLNFILLENLLQALPLLQDTGFADIEAIQLQLSQLTKLGQGHYFKPNNPAYMISCRKGAV
jgi:cobalt-precorrin-6B (C15)-methyltransferase